MTLSFGTLCPILHVIGMTIAAPPTTAAFRHYTCSLQCMRIQACLRRTTHVDVEYHLLQAVAPCLLLRLHLVWRQAGNQQEGLCAALGVAHGARAKLLCLWEVLVERCMPILHDHQLTSGRYRHVAHGAAHANASNASIICST